MPRFKTSYVSLLLISGALVHCGRDATSEPASPSPGPETASAEGPPPQTEPMTPASGTSDKGSTEAAAVEAPAPAPAAAPLSDEQIAMVMDLANTSEIEQGKLAQTKAKDARVKKFAGMMVSHHSKAKEKGSKLTAQLKLKPADSTVATQLKSDSETMMTSLKTAPAADFDRTYIASQVDAHQKVLSALNDQLIPSAQQAELKALLGEMRTTVESHLKEAQQLQNELGATAPSSPGTAATAPAKK